MSATEVWDLSAFDFQSAGPIPEPIGRVETQRRYRRSEKGKQAQWRADYIGQTARNEKERDKRDQRPFIAWDGEGYNHGGRHVFALWASSTGDRIQTIDPRGLSTVRCLDLLLRVHHANPGSIHVIYGGSYDVNMILRDLDEDQLRKLRDLRSVELTLEGTDGEPVSYRFRWRPGKSFTVKRGDEPGVILYDVVSFFQCSFVKACDEYLGKEWFDRDRIMEFKDYRAKFTVDMLPDLVQYNDAELVNLVLLMNELRSRLFNAGLRITRWDGPGAVAGALMQRERIKDCFGTIPDEVAQASRFAYFGGRFEIIKHGVVDGPAFEYDLRSAYPAALRTVPSLKHGHWAHVRTYEPRRFGLWHVVWTDPEDGHTRPQPLPWRSETGGVYFPWSGEGWYWGPEVDALVDTVPMERFHILEGWLFVPDPDAPRPFEFVDGLYLKRAALKRAGDGAHVGIKLGLNSLYGKLAQQLGAVRLRDGKWRIPPYHCLEYAGYVTSFTRAAVFRAAQLDPDAVIAFETDALFTTRPLPLPLVDELGSWEGSEFSSLAYIVSGFYFGTLTDGREVSKTRGVNLGRVTRDEVVDALRSGAQFVEASVTRFIGHKVALRGRMRDWRTWVTSPRRIQLVPDEKRIPIPDVDYRTIGDWHPTHPRPITSPGMEPPMSHEFPIEWINPNRGMDLADLRDDSVEQWQEEY